MAVGDKRHYIVNSIKTGAPGEVAVQPGCPEKRMRLSGSKKRDRKLSPKSLIVGSGGGTRTPDTRIMIPLL